MKNKKAVIIITVGVLVLLATAPWMNKQDIHDDILQKYGKQDGSTDKEGNLFCDYESKWLPFGRWVVSCEGGYFVPFFYIKKGNNDNVQKQQIHENNKVATETADWKTYRNKEYGFEFKYPARLSFSEINGDGKPRFWVGYEKIKNKFQPEGERAESVGVLVYDNLKNLNTEDFLTFLEENESWKKYSSQIKINDLSAIKIEHTSVGIETGTNYDNADIYLKNGVLVYKIYYDRISGLNDLENVFNQIFSTFKFQPKNHSQAGF